MSLGFTDSRQGVLDAIYRMGVACCAYSGGDRWADRCDCKYGVADRSQKWPTLHEQGNGCPELRSLHGVIDAMTDDEWGLLVQRAGGILRGSLFGTDPAARLPRIALAVEAARMQLDAIAAELEGGDERKGAPAS